MVGFFRRLVITLGLAAIVTNLDAQQQPAATQAQVDQIFSRWTRATPGCAVGVNVKGQPVVRAAYGMADLEHDVPNSIETIFETGSVAKQFTAAAVLLLARDGKLSLDDPIRKYFPELHQATAAVTIRQMLNHTAGLRDWGYLVAVAGAPRGGHVNTHADVLDMLSRQRGLDFPPGTRWSYSNSGYNLAAILVARVSGMSFSDFTKARIFDPLGMRDSSWRDDWTRIVPRRAAGYSERQGRFANEMPFENAYGNGGMLTTVGDLLKWNENFTSPVVGDAAFVAELQRRATFNDGRTHEYALGLYVDTYQGVREVDHSGGGIGYSAHLGRYPDQQVSVAVLCNSTSANPTAPAKAVARLFLTGLRAAPPPTAAYTLTAAEGVTLAGLYRSTLPVGAITVVHDQEGLRVPNSGRLIAATATRFATADNVTFEFDSRGGLRTIDEFGTATMYERVDPFRPSVAQLQAFAGRYFSDEVDAAFAVRVNDGRLEIGPRPDLMSPLTPIYADTFNGPIGWITFHRNEAKLIVGLSIGGDRMWNLPFTRLLQP